ncbi:Hypothetical protein AA314_00328 [Archangium gephyra]|uniref:T6SS Phospholipase effector Tle1-like catalytic domain-containing protein n=1 Tax=Archangium gephyra TaxID=48 RepID=A0AAC8Q0U9_9BACT|nr:Hypothetical protein AA314_00328 [Archangium gephyra]
MLPCQKGPPEQKPLRVRVSLFFDGTGNNRVNVGDGPGPGVREDASYANGLSNIARLESEGLGGQKGPGVDVHFTVYTEGIGTIDRGADSTRGFGLGTGETGVVAKVERGIASAVAELQVLAKECRKIELLHIDTFGFSRGAAAARYCLWKCMQEVKLTLKERVEAFLITVGEVSVKFVGLYDTVASLGLNHDHNTAELHLDAISQAEKVVQLAAAEEHRNKFRLTNINSAGGKGKQLFLPGVHSDVGGGYATSETEKDWELFDLSVLQFGASARAAVERERDWLISAGWYRREELSPAGGRQIKANRSGIKNTYSHIPLRIMARFARENGVPISGQLEARYEVPEELSQAAAAIQAYVDSVGNASTPGDWFKSNPALDPQWHRDMRHGYLHFSSRYGETFGAHNPHWSEAGPLKGYRERVIQDG